MIVAGAGAGRQESPLTKNSEELLIEVRRRKAQLRTALAADKTSHFRDTAAVLLEQIRQRKGQLVAALAQHSSSVGLTAKNPYIVEADRARAPRHRPQKFSFDDPAKRADEAAWSAAAADLAEDEREWLAKLPFDRGNLQWWNTDNVGAPSAAIWHPVEHDPWWEASGPGDAVMYLTGREQRRKRQNERFWARREAQDRVRLGLDPPPPPKLRPANVAAVYGTEYILDPTKFETLAQEAVAARRAAHDAANSARQLDSGARWAKHEARVARDIARGRECAVFRVEILADPKHKFVVDAAAKKLLVTGTALSVLDGFSLVIVESGAPEISKFQKVMLNRIKWTVPIDPRERENGDVKMEIEEVNSDATADSATAGKVGAGAGPGLASLEGNQCTLVWRGPIREPRFLRWSMHKLNTARSRTLLASRNADTFWQAARGPVYR